MSVGVSKILNRHARHEKILEDAILNDIDALSRHTLVIVFIPAAELDAVERAPRGIVRYAEEVGQNRLVDFLGEGLSFFFAALPMTFEPVPKHLMEKYGRCASGEQRRPVEGFGQRSVAERLQIRGHFLHARCYFGLRRQLLDAFGLKG